MKKKKPQPSEEQPSKVTIDERLELNLIHATLFQQFAQFQKQNPGKRMIEFESKEVEALVYG
jgi:hypothetical protein